MNAVEIYEKATWDLEHSKITLGEFEERIRVLYDVEPVRHGRWYEKHVDSIFGTKHILTCSECGGTLSTTDEALPYEKYCRECGAKMDGKEQEHESFNNV